MRVTVNGTPQEISPETAQKNLAAWLREDLLLTGTKIGCGTGVCGSCTILLDNQALRSCKLSVKDAVGKNLLTIEGLRSADGSLHPIQQAFVDCGAIQCGFCTPGMVLSTYAFLLVNPDPTREQARKAIKGNICRCTGYQQIVDAILKAAEELRAQTVKL